MKADELFTHEDMTFAGSSLNELHYGSEAVQDLVLRTQWWGLRGCARK